jgi:hypothetical protein
MTPNRNSLIYQVSSVKTIFQIFKKKNNSKNCIFTRYITKQKLDNQ